MSFIPQGQRVSPKRALNLVAYSDGGRVRWRAGRRWTMRSFGHSHNRSFCLRFSVGDCQRLRSWATTLLGDLWKCELVHFKNDHESYSLRLGTGTIRVIVRHGVCKCQQGQ